MTTPRQAAKLVKKHGSIRAAARAVHGAGVTFYQIQKAYAQAVAAGLAEDRLGAPANGSAKIGKTPAVSVDGMRGMRPTRGYLKPKKVKRLGTGTKRFHIFTCAQNNTKVHPEFWPNLLAFKEYLGAELHVGRITYNNYSPHPTKSKRQLYGDKEMWWDEAVHPYIDDNRIDIAPHLRWCGDMDTLPTAERPLRGLESYTGSASAIFPHVKHALESIARGKNEPTKLIMTTGTVTLRNYIQRKTGLKADFHHVYGALLIEVDEDGFWFPRQINADSTGAFYDLKRDNGDGLVFVKNGVVTEGYDSEGIYWPDPQIVEEDKELIELAFGKGGIKDQLRPKHDFMGDVGSFKSRSHWDMKDIYKRFTRYIQGLGNVEAEGEEISAFVDKAWREWCETHVLDGNHERHIGIWLREHNGMLDPINAEIWLRLQKRVLEYIRSTGEEPNFLEALLLEVAPKTAKKVHFLHRDESFVLCNDAGGGIECGEHGDDGTHGGKGSTPSHAKSGRKKCLGHAWAQIFDGIFRASSFSRRGLDWTHGNTAMNTCAFINIYPNGKRSLNFLYVCNGVPKWRA